MTYKQNSTNIGPPYDRNRYEQLDFVVTPNRWNNSVKNCEADPSCPIRSDHFPILTSIQIKLKADINKHIKVRAELEKFEEQKRYDYNRIVKE